MKHIPKVRTGSAGYEITSMSTQDVKADVSDITLVIPAEDLKAALWEPDVIENPESDEAWGGWSWAFSLNDGGQVLITNDRRGGHRWTVWVEDSGANNQALGALLDIIDHAGFKVTLSQYCSYAVEMDKTDGLGY